MAQPWHGRFCWYELMTTDPRAAEGFYSKVVGWRAEPFPDGGPYTLWKKGEENVGGLMELPAEAKAGGAPPNWMAYVAVEDADATAARAAALGGKVELPPTEIPSVGRFAVLSDPAGAHFAIMQPSDPSAGRPDAPPGPLDFSWRELATTDREGAMAFYAVLFGWEKQGANDMGSRSASTRSSAGPECRSAACTRSPPTCPSRRTGSPTRKCPTSRRRSPR